MSKKEAPHRKPLFGGKYTAEEVHSHYAFAPGERCVICKGPPLVRIRVYADPQEMLLREPEAVFALAAQHQGKLPAVKLKLNGSEREMVVWSASAFCKRCTPEAERRVAREAPSWCHVEIDRGPGPEKRVVAPNTDVR
jgi:hypothetical protein